MVPAGSLSTSGAPPSLPLRSPVNLGDRRDAMTGGRRTPLHTQGKITQAYTKWEDCAEACAWAGEDVCTAYEFDPRRKVCFFRFGCTGRLQWNTTQNEWQVGYCRRVDKPPEVLVDTTYVSLPATDFQAWDAQEAAMGASPHSSVQTHHMFVAL